jgi:bifunctional DNase/RNase
MTDETMLPVTLSRIVMHEGGDRQYIFLQRDTDEGPRGFPIVIGAHEALEIQRVVHAKETERPLTHQMAFDTLEALKVKIQSVDIVKLRKNTFFARLVLLRNDEVVHVDARPSDAIALALRARCQIRVEESVFERASKQDDSKT